MAAAPAISYAAPAVSYAAPAVSYAAPAVSYAAAPAVVKAVAAPATTSFTTFSSVSVEQEIAKQKSRIWGCNCRCLK